MSGSEPGTEAPQEDFGQQDPSLTNILGLIGQLLAQSQAAEVPSSSGSGRQAQFVWRFGNAGQHEDNSGAAPTEDNAIDIDELQNSLQFVLVRIASLERRPVYWSAQVEELQSANARLERCRQGTVANPQQVAEQVQAYVDTVNAQLDEFLTQAEARQQQERQRQQASSSYQPTSPHAPPLAPSSTNQAPSSNSYASSPPEASQHTPASSQAPTAASSGAWQWKWGWGQPPAGTLPDDPPSTSQPDASAVQQAIGAGLTNAASAAASAASSIYRRFAAAVGAAAAPTRDESVDQHAQHDGPAESSGGSGPQQNRARQPAHASAGPSNARQAQQDEALPAMGPDGLPIGQAYEAIRNIFDQHVDPQSRLGQWGAVAQHLGNLHAEINPADRQQQDAGRMLAAAVNAYSAYRRASAASQQ